MLHTEPLRLMNMVIENDLEMKDYNEKTHVLVNLTNSENQSSHFSQVNAVWFPKDYNMRNMYSDIKTLMEKGQKPV